MRKWLLLSFLAAGGLAVLAGCATVAQTADENVATRRQIEELGYRQVADDWNLIWVMDRQSRLSRWNSR